MNASIAKSLAVSKVNRGMLWARKSSPEILLALGIVGIAGSLYGVYKATLKVDEVKKESDDNFARIKNGMETIVDGSYTEEDYKEDLFKANVKMVASYAQLYAPSVILAIFSIGLMVQSNRILNNRNAALAAAYKLLDEGYKAYRKRVTEELGTSADAHFRHGIPLKKPLVVVDEEGKTPEFFEPEKPEDVKIPGESQYAKFFDNASPEWRKNNDLNIFFLRTVQIFANEKLRLQGHLFLNEVYDMIGIPRTKAGAVVGWVMGHGDDIVDFDIYNPINDYNRDFVNGYHREWILLDFNVDGVIYDLI